MPSTCIVRTGSSISGQLTSLSAAPITSSPPNDGSGSRTLETSAAASSVEAGADQVLLALLQELGVGPEADVDDTVVGVALDGPGAGLVDAEAAGLECRLLRRSRRRPGLEERADEHDVGQPRGAHSPSGRRPATSGPSGTTRGRRRAEVVPGRPPELPSAQDGDGRREQRRPRGGAVVVPSSGGRTVKGYAPVPSVRPSRSATVERRRPLLQERPHGLGRVGGGEVDRLGRALRRRAPARA